MISPAIELLVRSHQPLVRHIAKQVRSAVPRPPDLDDLVAYGQVGLLQAARRFDPKCGLQFSTFAYYRIRGAILDGLTQWSGITRAQQKLLRCERMMDEVGESTGSSAGRAEDAEPLADQARSIRDTVAKMARIYLAAELDREEEEAAPQSRAAPPPIVQAAAAEERTMVQAALNQLSGDSRKLMDLVYHEGKSLQEAATALGISRSWASRIHAKAVDYLRNLLPAQT